MMDVERVSGIRGGTMAWVRRIARRLPRSPQGRITFALLIAAGLFAGTALLGSIPRARLLDPRPTALLVDRHYRFLAELENSEGGFGYWPLPDPLPEKIEVCARAAEDRRFYSHPGVDIRAIGRALVDNYVRRRGFSGASTIAMQVARLQHPAGRTWHAKLREAFTALWLTALHGRTRVLRQYLTIAPYGNRIAGINYAARRYYQKPLADLSWAEAALLTAVPNAPGAMNLHRKAGRMRASARAVKIIRRARDYGWLDSAVAEDALREIPQVNPPGREHRSDNTLHAVIAAAESTQRNGMNAGSSHNPTVRLALDANLQDTVQSIAMGHMDRLRKYDAGNIGVLVLERKTGEVLSYLGSELYFDAANAGAIDYVRTPRSTGSLLKPFIYAFGMEWNGCTPATLLTDVGLHFGDGTQPFVPRNYDSEYLGPVLYSVALANSRNIPAVQVLRDVGLDLVYRKMAALGLTEDDGRADYYGLGLAVGNLYSSLYSLCGAYLSLANEGRSVRPHLVYGDRDPVRRQMIDRDAAMQIQLILSDPQARLPSFPRGGFLEYPFPVAVKTGTSRGHRDAWAIAWSDTYLVGVWIGRHDNASTKGLNGYGAAAPVVKDILLGLHPERADGFANVRFPPPEGFRKLLVSRLTGERADTATPFATEAWFRPGTEPLTTSHALQWLRVDSRNGLLATPQCPDRYVEPRRFFVLPPLFKDWAAAQGLPTPPSLYSPLCGGGPMVDSYDVEVVSPTDKARLFVDPEMPERDNVVVLNCRVNPRAGEVMWLVDGREYDVAPYPYTTEWPIETGRHTFKAVVPYTTFESRAVEIEVF